MLVRAVDVQNSYTWDVWKPSTSRWDGITTKHNRGRPFQIFQKNRWSEYQTLGVYHSSYSVLRTSPVSWRGSSHESFLYTLKKTLHSLPIVKRVMVQKSGQLTSWYDTYHIIPLFTTVLAPSNRWLSFGISEPSGQNVERRPWPAGGVPNHGVLHHRCPLWSGQGKVSSPHGWLLVASVDGFCWFVDSLDVKIQHVFFCFLGKWWYQLVQVSQNHSIVFF